MGERLLGFLCVRPFLPEEMLLLPIITLRAVSPLLRLVVGDLRLRHTHPQAKVRLLVSSGSLRRAHLLRSTTLHELEALCILHGRLVLSKRVRNKLVLP